MPVHTENIYKHRDDGVTEIHLLHGRVALIDTADFELVRKHRWHAVKAREAWYVYTNVKSYTNKCGWTLLGLHCLLLQTKLHVDHRNGNGLNNRRYNLRAATRSQNKFNGKNKAKGVLLMPDKRRKPWQAHIAFEGRSISKYFATEAEAVAYRLELEKKYYGDFQHEFAS